MAGEVRKALAGGTVPHLVVSLRGDNKALEPGALDWPAMVPLPVFRKGAVEDIDPFQRLREVFDAVEIAVVARFLSGEHSVNGVMEVIAPDPSHTVAAELSWTDKLWVVQIAFGDQRHFAPFGGRERFDLNLKLLQ